jgi:hypothetical protein
MTYIDLPGGIYEVNEVLSDWRKRPAFPGPEPLLWFSPDHWCYGTENLRMLAESIAKKKDPKQ